MATSSHKLTCRNGHSFPLPPELADQEVVPCPACTVDVVVSRVTPVAPKSGTPVGDEVSAPRARGLWQLMGRQQTEPESTPSDAAAAESSPKQREQAPNKSSAPADSPAKPRGLWALMGAPAESEVVPLSSDVERRETSIEPLDLAEAARPEFMKRRAPASESAESFRSDPLASAQVGNAPSSLRLFPPSEMPNAAVESLDEDDEQDGQEVDDDLESLPARPTGLLASDGEHPLAALHQARTLRRCRIALACGVVATLLSPLNLVPMIAAKIPGVVIGLVAVFFGHQAFNDARRCAERKRLSVLAMSAIAAGLLGMLAGPAGLIAVGQRWHQASLQRGATDRLQKIGLAIDGYEKDSDEYPKGGTVARDADGDEIGMHGWMTFLLPYLGQEELHRKLNLKQPFDHASNKPVMSQVVPEYLVPNVDHVPTKTGLATTHYAGVGGQGNGVNGIVNYGIFNRNVTVRRGDVTDGLSQTLIVGEIAQQLPAWGDPENWREIETGLNRHSLGFGNKDGTGAHFLMGDGSVRFFPNSTSREVLEKLSTRDGAETGMLLSQ